MARAALCLVAVLALTASAYACSAPKGACTASKCSSYVLSDYATFADQNFAASEAGWASAPQKIKDNVGYYLGVYNKGWGEANKNVKGHPAVNFERFDNESSYVLWSSGMQSSSSYTMAACCNACRQFAKCVAFQYYAYASNGQFNGNVICQLLSGGTQAGELSFEFDSTGKKLATPQTFGLPLSGTQGEQAAGNCGTGPGKNSCTRKSIYPSFVVARCNPYVDNDPHFVGARGTRFDFNGELDKSFCLATDTRIQVNALLKGYKAEAEGKAIRSWIKEVGVLYLDSDNKQHSLRMSARVGKELARGSGFLAELVLDGTPLAIPTTAGAFAQEGDLALTFLGTSKVGAFDLDRFSLSVRGLLDLEVNLRVAHPKLQTPEDSEVHFNLAINSITTTDKIHGVLGQTYRNTPSQAKKALKYSELSRLLNAPVVADGETGKGFLEGSVKDYETSSVLAADCAFSSFAQ